MSQKITESEPEVQECVCFYLFIYFNLSQPWTPNLRKTKPRKMHRRTFAKCYLQVQRVHGPPFAASSDGRVGRPHFQHHSLRREQIFTHRTAERDSTPAHFSLTSSSLRVRTYFKLSSTIKHDKRSPPGPFHTLC